MKFIGKFVFLPKLFVSWNYALHYCGEIIVCPCIIFIPESCASSTHFLSLPDSLLTTTCIMRRSTRSLNWCLLYISINNLDCRSDRYPFETVDTISAWPPPREQLYNHTMPNSRILELIAKNLSLSKNALAVGNEKIPPHPLGWCDEYLLAPLLLNGKRGTWSSYPKSTGATARYRFSTAQ